jgi:hypothetical protein|tara:strand:- start:21 stop:572 length:552 start_codon:yes stop_codon:yes gene_type:complete
MSNVWTTLSAIDVSKHIEKKGQLSYLSWAYAWGTLMKHYPDASYCYFEPNIAPDGSVEVEVELTIEGITRRMWLPVMDNRNNSIISPTSRQVSDTRMRCLVKCIAMFGLGHYIYAGEDLPLAVVDTPISDNQSAKLKALLESTDSDVKKFCQVFKCKTVDDLSVAQYDRALSMLEKKLENTES